MGGLESGNLVDKKKVKVNQIATKNIFADFKSDYFLVKLSHYLRRKKLLYIVKYNKKIKNRINININDYKEYSQTYTLIEIEIKPIKNKYDRFINYEQENEKYYHIYSNNNSEEIKRNYIIPGDRFNLIKIIIDYKVKSFKELFKDCKINKSIYFKKFYRNNLNDMSHMFDGCSSLKELNINNFKTDNAKDMSYMFAGCSSLKELKVNTFNTNNVTNM